MTEFHAGDRVRLTKGDTVVEGVVSKSPTMSIDDAWDSEVLWLADRDVKSWVSGGYGAELIEAAPKPLPTDGWWYDKKDQSQVWCFYDHGKGPRVEKYELYDDMKPEDWDFDGTEEWVRIDHESA